MSTSFLALSLAYFSLKSKESAIGKIREEAKIARIQKGAVQCHFHNYIPLLPIRFLSSTVRIRSYVKTSESVRLSNISDYRYQCLAWGG